MSDNLVPRDAYDVDETGYWRRASVAVGGFFGAAMWLVLMGMALAVFGAAGHPDALAPVVAVVTFVCARSAEQYLASSGRGESAGRRRGSWTGSTRWTHASPRVSKRMRRSDTGFPGA
jgi:hypothetical protein